MRKVLFILILIIGSNQLMAQSIRLATYNIRGILARDVPVNMWKDRVGLVIPLIQFHDFDVFGVQEANEEQLSDLEKALPGYGIIAENKNNGLNTSAIFYKKSKFNFQKSGHFWLSATPDVEGKGWDAKHPRGCSWVELTDVKKNFKFYFFNTHFDHVGVQARKNSAKLIIEKIDQIAGNNPAAVVGDFNFDQRDENFAYIKTFNKLFDSYEVAKFKYEPNGTSNSFNITKKSDARIDHIFITKQFEALKYGVLTDNSGGKFPSDHFPVVVDVITKK
jgi:endonuclease/exonuclease/phosphatase family metal-dependent hydrolase